MKKIIKIDMVKVYHKLNKRWIGHVYGYLIFILFVSLGVVIGSIISIWLITIASWLVGITLSIVYPFTIIITLAKAEYKKDKLESG